MLRTGRPQCQLLLTTIGGVKFAEGCVGITGNTLNLLFPMKVEQAAVSPAFHEETPGRTICRISVVTQRCPACVFT